jgi:hypothetical protein
MTERRRKPAHIIGKGIKTSELTKIDVAEALIKTAIRLFFEDDDPVPIYALANAAREILTNLGAHEGVTTLLHALGNRDGKTIQELTAESRKIANFFKHADRDPEAKIKFREDEADTILAVACQDFGRITGGMPVEAQIYEVWVYSLAYAKVAEAPLRAQGMIKFAIRQFPGIRTADRRAQKKLGLDLLNRMINDPDLQMQYRREVRAALIGKAAEREK